MSEPVDVVAQFQAGYDFPLDDYQKEACRRLAAGTGVLVAAPTGAGKTVVGEFAVFLARQSGRKCFYTTPIKALSNQKYHDLAAVWGADQVGLLTGDQTVHGEAPIVVMTTEVLRNMNYARSATLEGLDYVVLDEVHYLADRFRGPVWEEVILSLEPSVRLVALSATVSNVEEFGDWLTQVRGSMETIVSERRPVPLFQHVFAGRRLYDLYQAAPAEATDQMTEQMAVTPRVNPELITLAKQESRGLRDDSRRPRGRSGKGKRQVSYGSGAFGGASAGRFANQSRLTPRRADIVRALEQHHLLPAIFFIFSRRGCDLAIKHLVADDVWLTSGSQRRALLAIADQAADNLSRTDLGAVRYDDWREAFARGLAAHHAGLLPIFKQAVEEAFRQGLLHVVCATETLALGVNLPARTVVLERLVKYNGQSHVDITAGEYTQLTGRAGRRGIDVEGHAVVAWAPGLDPRALAGLAARRTYPLRSAFNPTANMVVNLIGSLGSDQARHLLDRSFAQFQTDRARGSRGRNRSQALVERFDRVSGVLESLGYLQSGQLSDWLEDSGLVSAPAATADVADSTDTGRADPDLVIVTDQGRMLSRIYGEQDLVVAEAIQAGIFTDLSGPALAAVLSTLVFESRLRDRRPIPPMPDAASGRALTGLRRIVRQVAQVERDFRLDPRPDLEPGFALTAYRWAQGADLAFVLDQSDLTAGDFVRWIRQTMDLAGQIADALRTGPLASACRDLVRSLRRGVIIQADDLI
ncbi:MAG: DEAD/DEAH box helicase [Propionibacteriaceae bacterium]|nr:DEAD/DEAH box helicase [Propionibacteriaceae bacterium]